MKIRRNFLYSTWYAPGLFVLIVSFMLSSGVNAQSTRAFTESAFLGGAVVTTCTDCSASPVHIRFYNTQVFSSPSILSFSLQMRVADLVGGEGDYLTNSSLYLSASPGGGLTDANGNLTCSVTNAVVTTGSVVSYGAFARQRVDGTLFTQIVSGGFTSKGDTVITPSESFLPVSSSFQTIAYVRCNIEDTSLTANLGVDALSWDQSMRYSQSQSSINPLDPISQISYVVVADNDLLRVELNGDAYAIDALVHSDRRGIDFSVSTSVSVLASDFLVFADAQGDLLNIVESTATVSYNTAGRNVLRVRVTPEFAVDTQTVVSNGTGNDNDIIPLGDGQELGDFVFNGSAPYISTATFSSNNTQLTLTFSEGVSYISTGDLIFSLVASATDGVSTATLQSITRNSSSEYILSLSLEGAAPSSEQFFTNTIPSVVAVGNEEINLRFVPFTVYDDTNDSAYQIQWATDRVLLQDTRAPSLSFVRDLRSEPHTLVVSSDDSGAIATRTDTFISAGVPDCSSLPPPSSFNTTYTLGSSVSYSGNTSAGTYYCFRAEDTAGNIAFLGVELNSESVLPVISVVEIVPSTSVLLYTTSRTLSITAQDQQTGLADIGFRVSTSATTVCEQSSFTSLYSEFTSGSTESVSVTSSLVTQTDVPLYVCAFATDISGNSLIASNNIVVVANIDRDAPTIAITGPTQAPSSMATIIGSVLGEETTTSAISGLASFGYALLTTSSQVCSTNTTVDNLANVSNPSITVSITENGVRACFVAIDNAGNRAVNLSEETTNIDNVAPVHPQMIVVSSENTVLEITYVGSNNIVFSSGAVAANNYGISVDVLNPDSVRSAVISTVTVSGMVLRVEVRPLASSGGVTFSVDGVNDVLVGSNIARSRYGDESYQVTIPGNTIRDAVGNIAQGQEVDSVALEANADPVLVTLGMRSEGSTVTVIDVVDTDATSASFTLSMIFSESVTTQSIATSNFTVYRIGTNTSIVVATTADSIGTIVFSTGSSHTLALAGVADVDGGSALSLQFSQIPFSVSGTSGYLVTYTNEGVATGGCLASDAGNYPYSNATSGSVCLATSPVEALGAESGMPTISRVEITPTTTEVAYAMVRSLGITASDPSGISVVGFSQSTKSSTACTASSETLAFQRDDLSVKTVVASRTFVQSTIDPVFVCAFAVDNISNRSTATTMIRVVSNIDADAPTISITGPTKNSSSGVTITGNISGNETTSSSVSGIKEFGFVEQLATAACTANVTLSTTLRDLVTNPNGILSFKTSENGVRLCFVATDNAGNVSVMPSEATTRIDTSAPQHSGVLTVSSENRLITIDYVEDGPTIHFTKQSINSVNRGITLAVVNEDSVRGVEFAAPPRTTGSQLVLEVDPLATNGLFGGDFSVDGVIGVLLQTFANDGSTTPTALSRAGVESYQVTIPANTVEDVYGISEAVSTTTEGKLTANADPVLVTLGKRDTGGNVEEIFGSVESTQGNVVSKFSIDMIFSETITTPLGVTFDDFRVYRFDNQTDFGSAVINSAVAAIAPDSTQLSIVTTTTSSDETLISLVFSGIPAPVGTVGYLVGFTNDGAASGGCYPNPQSGSYPYPNGMDGDICLGASPVVIGLEEHIFNIRVFLGGSF